MISTRWGIKLLVLLAVCQGATARDYEAKTGRYIESDPIGVNGGPSTYSYVGASPLGGRDPSGLCKVEARCNQLLAGPILGIQFSHCYLVVTEPGGGSNYFRGGPSSGGGGLSAASGNSRGGIGVGGDSGYGNIVTEYGPYGPGTIDWPTPRTPQTGSKTYINNDKPCTCINKQLANVLQGISGAGIPYNPLSTNSNATAFRALQSLGIAAPGSAPAPAPGWGIPLPYDDGGSSGSCCDQ